MSVRCNNGETLRALVSCGRKGNINTVELINNVTERDRQWNGALSATDEKLSRQVQCISLRLTLENAT